MNYNVKARLADGRSVQLVTVPASIYGQLEGYAPGAPSSYTVEKGPTGKFVCVREFGDSRVFWVRDYMLEELTFE